MYPVCVFHPLVFNLARIFRSVNSPSNGAPCPIAISTLCSFAKRNQKISSPMTVRILSNFMKHGCQTSSTTPWWISFTLPALNSLSILFLNARQESHDTASCRVQEARKRCLVCKPRCSAPLFEACFARELERSPPENP